MIYAELKASKSVFIDFDEAVNWTVKHIEKKIEDIEEICEYKDVKIYYVYVDDFIFFDSFYFNFFDSNKNRAVNDCSLNKLLFLFVLKTCSDKNKKEKLKKAIKKLEKVKSM